MSWQEISLAGVSESVSYGYTASASEDPIGPKFLRITDIVPECLDWGSVPYCEASEKDQNRFSLEVGDIVVARTGATVGYAKQIRDPESAVFASYLVRFRVDSELADPYFVGRLVESTTYKRYVKSQVGGAAQPNAIAKVLGRFVFRLPPRSIQQRIASVLSAYDDLIENNRQRIALLERAGRELYRGWFVRLRFPGHEHTNIFDGVPEGWERKTLGDVLSSLESGGRPKGGAQEEGIPSIGAENVTGIGQYDFTKEKYVPEEYFDAMRKGVLGSRDVVVYKDGANIGRSSYFGDGFPHEKCAVNEHVFILRVLPEVGQNLLYFWVAEDETRQRIANLNANTTQPGVSQGKLKTLGLVQTPNVIAGQFNEDFEPFVRQIFLLAQANQRLTEARDLLLPRLMSGEVAV